MVCIALLCQMHRWWTRRQQYKILKAWGRKYGVWFGLGFQSERTRVIERAWLTTVLPPYLRGSGVSVSVGLLSLRVGGYRRISDHGMYDVEVDTAGELAILGWSNGAEVRDGILVEAGEDQQERDQDPSDGGEARSEPVDGGAAVLV